LKILRRLWREAIDWLGLTFYVLAFVLVALSGWAAYANWAKSGWGSDAAAWIQAAGAIAAIAGASWLAQGEARRARRLRRKQNEEAAWYVRFAITQAQLESHIIASDLVNRTEPVGDDDVREWRQRATTAVLSLSALAERTDHVHPAVIHVTSNAKVLMDDLVEDLALLREAIHAGKAPDQRLIGRIIQPHTALLELIDVYDTRMQGVKVALDEGGDALPIEEWTTRKPKPQEPRSP
jgi:hypothetical protein